MKIPLSDVQKIYQDKSKVNAPLTVLMVFGSIFVFGILLMVISGGPFGN